VSRSGLIRVIAVIAEAAVGRLVVAHHDSLLGVGGELLSALCDCGRSSTNRRRQL
jgi:hypothetical protein